MANAKKLATGLAVGDCVLLEDGSAVIESIKRSRGFKVTLDNDTKYAIEVTYRNKKGFSLLHPNEEATLAD